MKKFPLIILTVVLVLATLACRLPLLRSVLETPAVTTEDTAQEENAPPAEETAEADVAASDLDETESAAGINAETKIYSDNGVEITLPSSYVLGDVEKDLAILVEGLQAMSEEDAEDIQQLYENNKDDIILWGYDTDSPASHQTSLLVMKNEEFAGMSLTIISTFANILLGEEVNIIEKERLTLGEKDVLRFLTAAENAGVQTAQSIYLFNDSGKLWLVGFFTDQGQIDTRLPTFDAAVESFTVLSME